VHYAYGRFLTTVEPDAALQEYEKELGVSPNHVPARIEAGFLCLKMGQFDKGLKYAQEAAKIEPRNALPHNLAGRILVEMNRTAEGIPELAQATRLLPRNSSFHMNLARAYQKAGETILAQKEIATFNVLEKKRAEQQPAAPK